MSEPTPQEKMKAILETVPLPKYEIKVYGSQITVECLCLESAEKWFMALNRFATSKKILETVVRTKGTEDRSRPEHLKVWRVYASI